MRRSLRPKTRKKREGKKEKQKQRNALNEAVLEGLEARVLGLLRLELLERLVPDSCEVEWHCRMRMGFSTLVACVRQIGRALLCRQIGRALLCRQIGRALLCRQMGLAPLSHVNDSHRHMQTYVRQVGRALLSLVSCT